MTEEKRIGKLEFQVKELCREVEKLRLTQCSILDQLEILDVALLEIKETDGTI